MMFGDGKGLVLPNDIWGWAFGHLIVVAFA